MHREHASAHDELDGGTRRWLTDGPRDQLTLTMPLLTHLPDDSMGIRRVVADDPRAEMYKPLPVWPDKTPTMRT